MKGKISAPSSLPLLLRSGGEAGLDEIVRDVPWVDLSLTL